MRELFGHGCACERCQLEQGLPEELAAQLEAVAASSSGAWGQAFQQGLMDQDLEALKELQVRERLGASTACAAFLLLASPLASSARCNWS
jgi:hypothetical protein